MLRVCIAILFLVALEGCAAGVVVGAGASVATTAAEERGLSVAIDDAKIQAAIDEKWLSANFDMLRNINLRVREGRVLMVGAAPDEKLVAEAVRLAWQVPGVKDVYNEVFITQSQGVLDYSRDTWIATQLQAEMTFNGKIYAINFTVDVVNGTVYLLGIARSQAELDRVVDLARNLRYVRRVVNHVRVMERADKRLSFPPEQA